jgi:hypothetical protein
MEAAAIPESGFGILNPKHSTLPAPGPAVHGLPFSGPSSLGYAPFHSLERGHGVDDRGFQLDGSCLESFRNPGLGRVPLLERLWERRAELSLKCLQSSVFLQEKRLVGAVACPGLCVQRKGVLGTLVAA